MASAVFTGAMLKRLICALGALLLVTVTAAGGESQVAKDLPRTKIVVVKDGPKPVYDLSGDIEPGAEDVFRELVGERYGGWLELRSMGGDVRASIQIGKIARAHRIKTYVPEGTYCLSGCAIIWAGGYERYVAKGGIIGFHRPWHLINGEVVPGDVHALTAYFKGLGFSDVVVERFLWPPDTFYYLDGESARILGVDAHFAN